MREWDAYSNSKVGDKGKFFCSADKNRFCFMMISRAVPDIFKPPGVFSTIRPPTLE